MKNNTRIPAGRSASSRGSALLAMAARYPRSRFLGLIGGATRSVDSYSHAAAEVIIPHVLGVGYEDLQHAHTSWPVLARHTELFPELTLDAERLTADVARLGKAQADLLRFFDEELAPYHQIGDAAQAAVDPQAAGLEMQRDGRVVEVDLDVLLFEQSA